MKRNFRNLLMFSLVAGSLTMYSCKETKEDEAAEPMQHEMREGEEMNHDMDQAMNEDEILKDEIIAQFENQEVAGIYQHYINIKNALVQTDASLAQESAKQMLAALETIDANAGVAEAAQKIAAQSDVNTQREAFSELSRAMESQLEGALASGEIYKQYCPMAFEGKGDSWLSNSKEIRNPYYGDKMLKCGRVEATIK